MPDTNATPASDPDSPPPAAFLHRARAWLRRLPDHARLTPRQVGGVAAIVAVGCVVCLGLAVRLHELHERALRAEIAMAAQGRVELLRSSWLRSLEALHATVAYLEVTPEPTRDGFRRFASDSIQRLPEVQALEWIPRVGAEQREHYERAAWHDGYPGYRFSELGKHGRLQVAAARAEYFPVYYVEPPHRNLPALGLDLGAHPLRRSALDRARRSGEAAATAPVRLAQETQAGQFGLLVFAPVWAAAAEPALLRGFGLVVLRIRDFVLPAFASMDGLDVVIHDSEQPNLTLFSRSAADVTEPGAPWQRAWTHRTPLELAGRTWQLTFVPTPAFLRQRRSLEPYAYPLAALALTVLIAAYTVRGMRRTDEVQRRVRERTQALTHEVAVRRRVESALREAEAKYRNIFENAILGIFQSTPDGRFLDANPALARIYGYASPRELMLEVRDIRSQLYVDPGLRDHFTSLLREHGSVSDFVAEVVRKDGSGLWISETAVAVRGPDGALAYYEGSVQDISARISSEEAQRRSYEWLEERVHARTSELAQANQRLQAEVAVRKRAQEEAALARQAQRQFLANMSHEIRTPLNAIIGYSQILQRYDIHDALHREALLAIVQGGQHLLTLVDEVIDLSKIEAGYLRLQAADFNLGALISGLAFMFRAKCEKKGLLLRVEGLGVAPWWVRGDEGKLRQVLINLLGNAVKFTERGEVRLRVIPETQNAFRFEVIDSGQGIAPAEHALVFGEFYQSEPGRAAQGAGLGLAISRRLVELMGGSLALRSAAGWGSNFYFALDFEPPLAVVASEAKTQHPRIRLAEGTRCRALIVDDREANRNVLRHMLTAIGCEVDCAPSGEQALAQLPLVRPNIVFLDVLMPGMDGLETARAMRQTEPGSDVKLVAFSASALETQRASYLINGFDAFIPKPFRVERVNDCLAELLGVHFVAEVAGEPHAEPDFSKLRVPAPLLTQIREAAELYQVTRLRRSFDRLASCGDDHSALVARLRSRAALYDMAGVIQLVAGIPSDGGSAA